MNPLRGTYRYFHDGKAQDIEEPFEIAPQEGGFSLRGERNVGGKPLLRVEAGYNGTRCESLTLAWTGDVPRTFHYRHGGATLEWREDGGDVRQEPLPDPCLLFPLLRAATGFLLPTLAEAPCDLVLPNIRDQNDAAFLRPLHSRRHARRDAGDPAHFRYYGGEYGDAGADYWVNDQGLVSRYRWASPNGLWEVHLAK